MQLRLLIVALLFAVAFAQPKLNSLEGSYTSDSSYGQGLWLCLDDLLVQGSYDEVGVLQGTLTDNVARGEWWEAGSGPCKKGTFEFTYTNDGFVGFYTCDGSSTQLPWNETRTSIFRPSNDQCKLLSQTSGLSLEGTWIGEDGNPEYICFDDDEDDTANNVYASYVYDSEFFFGGDSAVLVEGYLDGIWSFGGRIIQSTWFEDLNAGASLNILRSDGTMEELWWTGIVGRGGVTVINEKDFNDPDRHQVWSYTGPNTVTAPECLQFNILKRFVFKNAPDDDDDDQYYFAGDNFEPAFGPYYDDYGRYFDDDNNGDDVGYVDDDNRSFLSGHGDDDDDNVDDDADDERGAAASLMIPLATVFAFVLAVIV